MACSVSEPWFTYIGNKKLVEGRLNRGVFKDLKVGELFIIHSKENPAVCKNTRITGIHICKDFTELYSKFGDKLLPKECLNFGEDDDDIYLKFYSKADIEKYGVIGVEFVLIE